MKILRKSKKNITTKLDKKKKIEKNIKTVRVIFHIGLKRLLQDKATQLRYKNKHQMKSASKIYRKN